MSERQGDGSSSRGVGKTEEVQESQPQGNTGETAEPTEDDGRTDDEGISRRGVLIGSGVLALGGGLGAYWLTDGFGDSGSDGRVPFSVWEAMQEGLRTSPDHLPATADQLVSEGDPQALYEFVRDDVGMQPPGTGGGDDFLTRAYAGPRATLRAGVGTPRENAELLSWLLDRAGYESSVVRYRVDVEASRKEDLYFGGPVHEFDPGFDLPKLRDWASQMRGDAEDAGDYTMVDEGGADSAALAERVRTGLHGDATLEATDFNWGPSEVPLVRFRESSEGSDSPNSEETTTGADTESASAWRYANLFHADASFGSVENPDELRETGSVDLPQVTASLEAARMDAPEERIELVSGGWDADDLVGRQLQILTLPGRSPVDYPRMTFDGLSTYVPALNVQDPSTSTEELAALARVGDPFDLTGGRITVDERGTLRKDGTVLREGDGELELLLEMPDGTTRTVTPVEAEMSVEEYYSYSDEQALDSFTPDGLEMEGATVTFLYKNTSTGKLSLVVLNDHPERADGGKVKLQFEGVGGYRWQVRDEPRRDTYTTLEGPLPGTETAEWGWSEGHTDGGAIGPLPVPFDVDITHYDEIDYNTERSGVDRWVFVDGDALDDPISIAEFTDDTGDVTASVRAEPVQEPNATESTTTAGADVEEVDVRVATDAYPEVRVTVVPLDADGVPVSNVPGSTVTVTEGEEPVSAQLTPTDAPGHTYTYRSPHREDGRGERSVRVGLSNGDAEGTTTYEVPGRATDPRAERGLCGLYLTLTVGDRTIHRTLAGWDPDLDEDREPSESDFDEVFSALWGGYSISFERAGVPPSVHIAEELGGKLSMKSLDEARATGDLETMRQASREGHGFLMQMASPFQPRLPDRFTDDSITFSTGLRTVLVGERPVFGEPRTIRTVDVLPTASTRTLTRDGDRHREFRLNMERTARTSVMERAAFETSTASVLADTTLTTVGEAKSAMASEVEQRLSVARSRRGVPEHSQLLTAASGETAAFWEVDGNTGSVVGVLPEGSGGARGQETIDTLERIERVLEQYPEFANKASSLATAPTGPQPSPGATAAKAYGRILVQLTAIAATSVATLSTQSYSNAVEAAISKRVCNIAGTIVNYQPSVVSKSDMSDLAEFMNNIPDAKDHTASTCQQNDYQ